MTIRLGVEDGRESHIAVLVIDFEINTLPCAALFTFFSAPTTVHVYKKRTVHSKRNSDQHVCRDIPNSWSANEKFKRMDEFSPMPPVKGTVMMRPKER
jgi:hypothetical protein